VPAEVRKTSASVCEHQLKAAGNLPGNRHSRCEVARLLAKQAFMVGALHIILDFWGRTTATPDQILGL
jgi:hypothetical protein